MSQRRWRASSSGRRPGGHRSRQWTRHTGADQYPGTGADRGCTRADHNGTNRHRSAPESTTEHHRAPQSTAETPKLDGAQPGSPAQCRRVRGRGADRRAAGRCDLADNRAPLGAPYDLMAWSRLCGGDSHARSPADLRNASGRKSTSAPRLDTRSHKSPQTGRALHSEIRRQGRYEALEGRNGIRGS